MYRVEIISYETGEVVESIKCESERKAERVDSGLNINLNHEEFYTVIVKES